MKLVYRNGLLQTSKEELNYNNDIGHDYEIKGNTVFFTEILYKSGFGDSVEVICIVDTDTNSKKTTVVKEATHTVKF